MTFPRNYNKLYARKNNDCNLNHLVVGYQSNSSEIVLEKDKTTIFHIPHFTSAFALSASTLVECGAFGGSAPATSDRIYKNQAVNYDKFKGNSPTWVCSWLYKDPTGTFQWMDRYYGINEDPSLDQTPYDAVFVDFPSTMVLEPGGLYKYHHTGENTFTQIISSMSGLSSQHLLMSLDGWGTEIQNSAPTSLSASIVTLAPRNVLYSNTNDSYRTTKNTLNFDHNYDLVATIDWNSKLDLNNEFAFCFWANSKDWTESPSTQLFGNFSTNGEGVGVFLETLSTYPFWVIPETIKKETIFVNQNGKVYANLKQERPPHFVALDNDNNVYTVSKDNPATIHKRDHLGNLLASTSNDSSFWLPFVDEEPIGLFCGCEDRVILLTTRGQYYFNSNLILQNSVTNNTSVSSVSIAQINKSTNATQIISRTDVRDMKYENGILWSISRADGNLYKNSELFAILDDNADTLQIAPDGNIWILFGNNSIAVFNKLKSVSDPALYTTAVGENKLHADRRISFIKRYDRATQTFAWKAVLVYSGEPFAYILSTIGDVSETITLQYLLNVSTNETDTIRFGRGDFTGYEFKRLFQQLDSSDSSPRLIIRSNIKQNSSFTETKQYASILGWNKNSWQHIAVTYKNKTFTLYVNGNVVSQFTHNGSGSVSSKIQTPWFLGTSTGAGNGINKEINSVANIFNGKFADVKIYDYALTAEQLKTFYYEFSVSEDIYWQVQMPVAQHLETIQHTFKHKLPGHKSSFYNIKISGMNIEDEITKKLIEDHVKSVVSKISPLYTDCVNIKWL